MPPLCPDEVVMAEVEGEEEEEEEEGGLGLVALPHHLMMFGRCPET